MLKLELAAFYAQYEKELHEWIASYDRTVYCRKGCSSCCDVSVGMYLPEAIVLAETLNEAQYARVAAHTRRVLEYARQTDEYISGYRFAAIGACPFLDATNGACSIYEQRPANCRHVFSSLPPEYCAKDTPARLDRDLAKQAEFLRRLDPRVNEYGLPYVTPLEKIFSEKYQLYLIFLNAKYFDFIVLGEMSWLIMLARDHDLRGMTTGTNGRRSDFLRALQQTGLYHEHLLTDCQEVLPHFKEAGLAITFAD